MNLVDVGDGRPLKLGDAEVVLEGPAASAVEKATGRITVGFRPEALRVGDGPLRAQVRTAEDLGSEVFVHVAVDHLGEQLPLVSKMPPPFEVEPGDNVTLQIIGKTHVFDGDGHRVSSGPAKLR